MKMNLKKRLLTLLALLSTSGIDVVTAAQAQTTASQPTGKKKKKKNKQADVTPPTGVGTIASVDNAPSKDPAVKKKKGKNKKASTNNDKKKSAKNAGQTHYTQAHTKGAAVIVAPEDRMQNLSTMLALFQQSLTAGTLNDQQKRYVQNTLIPVLQNELSGAPLQASINNAFAQPDEAATVQHLAAIAQAQQGKAIDPTSQQVFGQALKDLIDTSMHLDPATLAALATLVKTATNSQLVGQDAGVSLQAALPALTEIPNQANTTIAITLANPQEKIDAMQALVDKADGTPLDTQVQNAFAGALQGLVDKADLLDHENMIRLSSLVNSAATSFMLTPEQQEYAQQTLAHAIDVEINPDIIQKIMVHGTPAQKMATLQELLSKNSGDSLDPATQNAFAQALSSLSAKTKTMTKQEHAVFTNLLEDATTGNALSKAQKHYVKTQMIPAIAPTPSIKAIDEIMKHGRAEQKMEALKELMVGAKPPVTPAIQNAYAQALQTLQEKLPKMSPSAKAKNRELLAKASKNDLLSPAQQKYVANTMLPASVPNPNRKNISSVMKTGNLGDQLDTLELMMKKQASKPVDPATQGAYAQAIQELQAKAGAGDFSPEEEVQLQKLIAAAGQAGLIDPQKQVQKSAGGTGGGSDKQQVTAAGVKNIMAPGTTPSQQIDGLMQLIQTQGDNPADPATQGAYAQAIQELQAKAATGQLLPTDQVKLQKIMALASQSGLLNKEQQEYAKQQAAAIALPVNAPTIASIAAQGSASDQLDALNAIIQQQGNTAADATTQNAYAQAIQSLMTKAKAGQLSVAEQAKLKQLMAASGKSGLLNPAQQQFVAQQAPNFAPQANAATITSIAAQGSASDQLDGLNAIMQQQGDTAADATTQNAYAQAIQALMTKAKAGQLSVAEQAKLKQLMAASGKSGLLNPTQQQFVAQQAPNFGPQANAATIASIAAQGSASDQLDGLNAIMQQQGDTAADATTQNAYAQAIQGLMAKAAAGKLSPAEQVKLKQLMAASGRSGLLNKAQQDYVTQNAQNIAVASASQTEGRPNNLQNEAFNQNAANVAQLFGQQLTLEQRNIAAGQLQALFESRPQNSRSLQATREALQKALDSGLLTPEQQAYVQQLLAQTTQEIAQAQANESANGSTPIENNARPLTDKGNQTATTAIQSADQQFAAANSATYGLELDKLDNLIKGARENTTAAQQAIYAQQIEAIFENRPIKDAEKLGRLMVQLGQIQNTSLVKEPFNKKIADMIQTLGTDQLRAMGAIK
jgi:hypothetical protein